VPARVRLDHVAGQVTAGTPQVHLEGERILPRLGVEHPLQRRVGDDAAVPVVLAVDLDRWETRRQGAARHDVLRPDPMGLVVEVDEVPGFDVDRADAESLLLGIDAVEVDQLLE